MAQINVSARAVDMLGRQQIAGIPTAIHELFKNAHDAYAKNVEIDYFRSENTLVLRDDGIGMTKNDFTSKWLTIGTSSKLGVNRKSHFIPKGMKERKLMGEKGIGRLAIAAVGRQVLVLTRAEREDKLHEMVAALVHWSFFEAPDISINDINIPIRTIQDGKLPDSELIASMVEEVRENALGIESLPNDLRDTILSDLELLDFSAQKVLDNLPGSDSLRGKGRGTHFIITPTDETLKLDIDSETKDKGSKLKRILVGFLNNFNEVDIDLNTQFRDYKDAGEPEEIIGQAFFDKEEIDSADHLIEGTFDEYGQFSGSVSVYGSEPQSHVISWDNRFSQPTRCGEFKIKFAYVQGESSESLVPLDNYLDLKQKLLRYGGLYLYKDGIRVLPYGSPDFDFLEFERKRTKRASTAFFSYRLIFGAIEITHDGNKELVEKAGREGLRENIAYKQFIDILGNFFDKLAADYFRDSSENDKFWEIKSKLKFDFDKKKEAVKRRNNSAKGKKEAFENQINDFFDKLESKVINSKASELKAEVLGKIESADSLWSKEEKLLFVMELNDSFKKEYNELLSNIKVSKPNVGLKNVTIQLWFEYLAAKDRLVNEVLEVEKSKIDSSISNYVKNNDLAFTRRNRVQSELDSDKKMLNKAVNDFRKEFNNDIEKLEQVIKENSRLKATALSQTISKIAADFNKTALDELDEKDAERVTSNWSRTINDAYDDANEHFMKLKESLDVVINEISSGDSSSIDLLVAVESENENFKETLSQYYEYAQLGMTIGIIQHEFNHVVDDIKNNIISLRSWGDSNPDLKVLYSNIANSFYHLEGYLKQFTPINRRLNRRKEIISGKNISDYIERVFYERFEKDNIKLSVLDGFYKKEVEIFPSSIYPVFINLVDNALYWLKFYGVDDATITLDGDENSFYISNNGKGIKLEDSLQIFDFGFSNKDDGRGMGLFISKQTLNREKYDISLQKSGRDVSPCFIISKLTEGK